jgi:hypothetical protein
VRTAAPEMRPSLLNWISTNLPNRDELSLRTVLALPNASSSGFDSSTCSQRGREAWYNGIWLSTMGIKVRVIQGTVGCHQKRASSPAPAYARSSEVL